MRNTTEYGLKPASYRKQNENELLFELNKNIKGAIKSDATT